LFVKRIENRRLEIVALLHPKKSKSPMKQLPILEFTMPLLIEEFAEGEHKARHRERRVA